MKGEKYHYDALVSIMTEKRGERLGTFLANRMAKAIRKTGDFCIDNIRVAKIDEPEEMAAYRKQKARGCCGFHDEVVTFYDYNIKSNIDYIIGFNYGH